MVICKINTFISTIFIILIILLINGIKSFKCIANKFTINPVILNITHNKIKRRILGNEDEEKRNYSNIKIGLDYTQFDSKIKELDDYENISGKIKTSINEAKEAMEKILMIEHEYINLSEVNYAESIIKRRCGIENINQTYQDFLIDNDIIIFPILNKSLNEIGDDILVSGKFCLITSEYRVLGGVLNINPYITFNSSYSQINFKYALFHELTHILIFHPTLLNYLGMVGDTEKHKVINSEKVLKKAREHYNCEEIDGIPLEDLGGEEIAGYHWDPRYMLGDDMISINYIDFVISDITLALFEDSGFYKVNYYTGGLFKFGKNKGCRFFLDNCIFNGSVSFENEFCTQPKEPKCTRSGTIKGRCTIYNYTNSEKIINKTYQYFEDINVGGLERIDFCPVPDYNEDDDVYLSQSCKYGNSNNGNDLGENFGNNSFCFISNLLNETSREKEKSEAVCYKIKCDNNSKTFIVSIGSKNINCSQSENITVNGYKGTFFCPNYNDVCHFMNNDSLICNEMFDCIKNEIEVDNSTYDYIINKRNDSKFLKLKFNILIIIIIRFLN